MLIDTHCHLDYIQADSEAVLQAATKKGLQALIVPGVSGQNLSRIIQLGTNFPQVFYALGIHPLMVDTSDETELVSLRSLVEEHSPVAVGEIGLDFYVQQENVDRQIMFFKQQLKIAQECKLPVILHVRGAIDAVLKCLRECPVVGGVAHAFNGSFQQAEQFIKLGFKLGYGGAMTFDRAKRIRRLASELPLSSIVLETDSPDMSPAWLEQSQQNTPAQLKKIAKVLAELRGVPFSTIAAQTTANAVSLFPALALTKSY